MPINSYKPKEIAGKCFYFQFPKGEVVVSN